MKVTANWHIELTTTCPHCKRHVDLMDNQDFFTDSDFEPLEYETNATRDVEVTCPDCDGEFTVDFHY